MGSKQALEFFRRYIGRKVLSAPTKPSLPATSPSSSYCREKQKAVKAELDMLESGPPSHAPHQHKGITLADGILTFGALYGIGYLDWVYAKRDELRGMGYKCREKQKAVKAELDMLERDVGVMKAELSARLS